METSGRSVNTSDFEALIFDLDGVVTHTARVHARAWKQVFDDYLGRVSEERDERFVPFDIDRDYARHVDGKPRYDGVRDFLASRGLRLPEGDPSDPPGRETVQGLGNRKNELYNQLLREGGVGVFDDTVEKIREWRELGLKTAIVSSSKNCAEVLRAAGLSDLFDVRVDGLEAERLDLSGKPAPDIFLEAARRLHVEPARAVVFEDAVSGVQAGHAGRFGWVIGVDRVGARDELLANGADTVVTDLRQVRTGG